MVYTNYTLKEILFQYFLTYFVKILVKPKDKKEIGVYTI
ncbi:hypothetical protein QSO_0965 [Clostridioides difficile P31]|nr:hypothetical protein QO7_0952 [Clostridioides difficile F314]EQI11181.1 hypothetical protein QO5_1091 [Clostridioides difficile F253]EQJ43025.1 hypothetical protein QSC_0960 [Clostridioides difficile P23]EQK07936.1 hypothetical protein QUI_1110 [Clostridioides difficile P59]EQK90037.1 hypothetical protein QSO_0965 [Clostridioides difficile P31]